MELTSPHSQSVPQDHLAPFPREEDRPILSRSRKLVTGSALRDCPSRTKPRRRTRSGKTCSSATKGHEREQRVKARRSVSRSRTASRELCARARKQRKPLQVALARLLRGVTASLCIANDERESEKRRDGLRPSWGGRRCPRSRTGRRGGAWRPAGDERGAGGSVRARERRAAGGGRERDGRTSTHERAGLWSPNTRE